MLVSLFIISYNEVRHLPDVLSDIVAQDFPKENIEVILVNSMSTDGTREIMQQFADNHSEFNRVVVCDNKKKTLPCGWNVALEIAKGDVVMKWDSHARFDESFITNSVNCINSGEDVCGGVRPCICDGDSDWQNTLLIAENSLFGSSFAPYRRSPGKSYVSSIFHGTYKRSVFGKVGGFDERLTRTEDNDIHYRIRQAGYKICFDESIKSKQIIRSSFKKMIRQKYLNGMWIGLTLGVQPKCLELYHFVPFAFVMAIIFTSILAAVGFPLLSVLMWSAYSLVDLLMTLASIIQNKKFHITQLLLAIIFPTLHIAYGIGTVVGLIKLPCWKAKNKECTEIDRIKNIISSEATEL
ncbi:MAG: glycosyltransferase family 2 protein [Clostridia bacterium]|nr:glycosyltransferase family 2 protein [Clostridia bacterium]